MIAIYDCNADAADELSFTKVRLIFTTMHAPWAQARTSILICILPSFLPSKQPNLFYRLEHFGTTLQGDLLLVDETAESDWWRGHIDGTPETEGLIPRNHTRELFAEEIKLMQTKNLVLDMAYASTLSVRPTSHFSFLFSFLFSLALLLSCSLALFICTHTHSLTHFSMPMSSRAF